MDRNNVVNANIVYGSQPYLDLVFNVELISDVASQFVFNELDFSKYLNQPVSKNTCEIIEYEIRSLIRKFINENILYYDSNEKIELHPKYSDVVEILT